MLLLIRYSAHLHHHKNALSSNRMMSMAEWLEMVEHMGLIAFGFVTMQQAG